MLVLTRRPGQTVIINEDIEVSVVSIKNGQVRLGFKAPPRIPIMRSELEKKYVGDCIGNGAQDSV